LAGMIVSRFKLLKNAPKRFEELALLGLAGIIGTFFAPPWAQRKIERRRERREFRRAVRGVAEELRLVALFFDHLGRRGVQLKISEEVRAAFLAGTEWREEKRVLATALPDEVWKDVTNAYFQLSGLRRMLLIDPKSGEPLADDTLTLVKTAATQIQAAADLLEKAEAIDD
jgi:hypothetical protein